MIGYHTFNMINKIIKQRRKERNKERGERKEDMKRGWEGKK